MNPELPADEYTAETVVAMATVPLVIIFFVIVAAVALVLWRRSHPDDPDRPLWLTSAIGAVAFAAVIGALLWWGMYPWQAEYHQWRAITGTVDTIDSRLTASQDGMQDKYVVTFQGNEQEYGVLDTRAAAVRPGDTLVITCVRRWQWSGAHGYDCNFIDFTRKSPR